MLPNHPHVVAFVILMSRILRSHHLLLLLVLLIAPCASGFAEASWSGVLTDAGGKPVGKAIVTLRAIVGTNECSTTTGTDGKFVFARIVAGSYEASVEIAGKQWKAASPIVVQDAATRPVALQLSASGQVLNIITSNGQSAAGNASAQASGGQHLSGTEVSSLPLNVRDFSKLLLLAAGTMTDTNGAANFTQQFTVNGQRGAATVFAMDGFDTTDAELGGATFNTFNVDAIEEVQSSSGVMPADIGHGAAGYTNVVTKSGADQIHGSIFEFARNAAFDARNYFDTTNGRRIPPFVRNEFGFTNGGPVVIPDAATSRSSCDRAAQRPTPRH